MAASSFGYIFTISDFAALAIKDGMVTPELQEDSEDPELNLVVSWFSALRDMIPFPIRMGSFKDHEGAWKIFIAIATKVEIHVGKGSLRHDEPSVDEYAQLRVLLKRDVEAKWHELDLRY